LVQRIQGAQPGRKRASRSSGGGDRWVSGRAGLICDPGSQLCSLAQVEFHCDVLYVHGRASVRENRNDPALRDALAGIFCVIQANPSKVDSFVESPGRRPADPLDHRRTSRIPISCVFKPTTGELPVRTRLAQRTRMASEGFPHGGSARVFLLSMFEFPPRDPFDQSNWTATLSCPLGARDHDRPPPLQP
jgi:hypothetical protein